METITIYHLPSGVTIINSNAIEGDSKWSQQTRGASIQEVVQTFQQDAEAEGYEVSGFSIDELRTGMKMARGTITK